MYNSFNIYLQIDDSKDLVFYNDVNYVEQQNIIDQNKLTNLLSNNKDFYNIYYISSKKVFSDYTWISNDFDADICILKTSNFDNFKHNIFKNVYLIVDDEEKFLDSMIYLYDNVTGFIDFKLKNKFNKNILTNQFEILSKFIVGRILEGKYTLIYQLNYFFEEKKFDTFGENSIFISPKLNIYRHPIFYWTNSNNFSSIDDFKFSEQFIHFSKPHIVCHNCETFYCDRNIYFNYNETTEYKVPAYTECNKTTFISMFQKNIFNNIQENISLNEVEILDKMTEDFNPSKEYARLSMNLCVTNKIKNFKVNYRDVAGEQKNWQHNFKK